MTPQSMPSAAMLEAGSRVLCRAYEIDDGFSEKQADQHAASEMGLNFRKEARDCYLAMQAARPTPDLGEDGELVEAMRATARVCCNAGDHISEQCINKGADRIEQLHAELVSRK